MLRPLSPLLDYSKQGPREVTSAAGVPECGKRFSLLMNPTSVGTSRCDVPRISGRHRRAAERGADGAARRPHQVQGEGECCFSIPSISSRAATIFRSAEFIPLQRQMTTSSEALIFIPRFAAVIEWS